MDETVEDGVAPGEKTEVTAGVLQFTNNGGNNGGGGGGEGLGTARSASHSNMGFGRIGG
jgi:hypothetical protein